VEARLGDDKDTTTRSFEIGVMAGEPANISLSQSGTSYVQKQGQTQVQAIVTDGSGNRVEDGTPIFFKIEGHAYIDEYDGFLVGGESNAAIKGGSASGSYSLTAISGQVSSSTNINVQPLQVELVGAPSATVANTTYSVVAKVTDGQGAAVSDVFVDIGVEGALVERDDVKTDASGEARFSFTTPEVNGNVVLAAKVDRSQPVLHIMSNSITSVHNLTGSSPFIVAGVDGNTDNAVNNFDGTSITVSLLESMDISLNGTADQPWSLAFDDYHFPNRPPIYFNRFSYPARDELQQYTAGFTGISRVPSPYLGISGLYFNGETSNGGTASEWHMEEINELKVASPAYNFWMRPNEAGTVLDVAESSINRRSTAISP
jgi:hypothetical protein